MYLSPKNKNAIEKSMNIKNTPIKYTLTMVSIFVITTSCLASVADTSNNETSVLIASSFLQERLKTTTNEYLFKTKEDRVYGGRDSCSATADLHDVKITVSKNQCDNVTCVILETTIFGTPEDFKNQNVLEHEKKLLKFILIRTYLDKLATIKDAENIVSIPIDKQTKTIIKPRFLIMTLKNGMWYSSETQTYSKEDMGMKFLTIFSMEEFDNLVKKYFADPEPAPKKSSSGWW